MTKEAAVAILVYYLLLKLLTNTKIKIERTRIREINGERIIESFKFELTLKE